MINMISDVTKVAGDLKGTWNTDDIGQNQKYHCGHDCKCK